MPATDNFGTFDAESVSDEMKGTVKNALVLGAFELSPYRNRLDQAVSSFPENIRDLVKTMLTDVVKSIIAKSSRNPGAVIDEVASQMAEAKHITNFLKVRNVTQEHLETFKNSALSLDVLKENFRHQINTRHVTRNTIHDNVLRDVDGLLITSMDNVDFNAIEDKNQRKETARTLFLEKVPQDMLGFVTNYVQQGGLTAQIFSGALHPDNPSRLFPDCPKVTDLMEDKANGMVDTNHIIKTDQNTIEITTNATVKVGITSALGSGLGLPNNGEYEICHFTVVTRIDISKGTDENGVPKGIELSIARKDS